MLYSVMMIRCPSPGCAATTSGAKNHGSMPWAQEAARHAATLRSWSSVSRCRGAATRPSHAARYSGRPPRTMIPGAIFLSGESFIRGMDSWAAGRASGTPARASCREMQNSVVFPGLENWCSPGGNLSKQRKCRPSPGETPGICLVARLENPYAPPCADGRGSISPGFPLGKAWCCLDFPQGKTRVVAWGKSATPGKPQGKHQGVAWGKAVCGRPHPTCRKIKRGMGNNASLERSPRQSYTIDHILLKLPEIPAPRGDSRGIPDPRVPEKLHFRRPWVFPRETPGENQSGDFPLTPWFSPGEKQ